MSAVPAGPPGPEEQRVLIFDTTLRDGEQSPGFSMNVKEKLVLARQLSRLGVDIIEAGFPASSPEDFESVRRIASEIGADDTGTEPPTICGLCRSVARSSLQRTPSVPITSSRQPS